MPTIGNIVEDGKLLVPVYVEGEGSSSSGSEESTTIIPTSTLGLTGGFYSGTFYGMALGSDGRLTTFSWNRSGDPVVISNGLSLPISGNPTVTGYMVYNEYIGTNSSTYGNCIHICQTGDTLTDGNFSENLSLRYYYYRYSSSPIQNFKIQFKNETSKNLLISLKVSGTMINADTSSSSKNLEISQTFSSQVNSNNTSDLLFNVDWDDSTNPTYSSSFSCTFTFQVLN